MLPEESPEFMNDRMMKTASAVLVFARPARRNVCHHWMWPLFAVLLAGCTTTTTYQSFSPDRPPKPDDYPIPIYTENMTLPRPCSVMGTVSIGDTDFTVFGGDIQVEIAKVLLQAHKRGADAVQIKSVQRPGYTDANYRLTARLLAYSDNWETINLSADQFAAYLKANRANLDPIEGVWDGRGLKPNYIGIMRDTSRPGREFVGFILGAEDPAWHPGYKKIDIRRGSGPGTYVLDYYLDNFSVREATILLNSNFTFTLMMPRSGNDNGGDDVTYFKNW